MRPNEQEVQSRMAIDRDDIVQWLRASGRTREADLAVAELPPRVDLGRDAAALAHCGIDPEALTERFGDAG